MRRFDKIFNQIMESNIAGGTGSVFSHGGEVDAGAYGNVFPANNDNAYAPGDTRLPKFLGSRKNTKKKRSKRKGQRLILHRRNFSGM